MSYLRQDLAERIKGFVPLAPEGPQSAVATAVEPATATNDITDVRTVASYSWMPSAPGSSVPVIAVPGSPGIWKANPVRVPADSGISEIDRNAHMVGDDLSTLTIIFAAVDAMPGDEVYDLKGLDIVTNRNSLRQLMRWANGIAKNDFRIDLDGCTSGTVLLTRREKSATEVIQGFAGYSKEYLKAALRLPQGLERSLGHYRIIEMSLGGLKVLMRFHADASADTTSTDDLADAISALSVKGPTSRASSSTTTTAKYKPSSIEGVNLFTLGPTSPSPHSSIIEVKTRGPKGGLHWKDIYPQVYLSQTPYLYLARHDRGTFQPPEKIEILGMASQAEKAKKGVGKIVEVLNEVLEIVRNEKGKTFSLICVKGKLELFRRRAGGGNVGEEILGRFKN